MGGVPTGARCEYARVKISFSQNIEALKTRRLLDQTATRIGDSIAVLSSGSRLIRPSSDPAGVSLAALLSRDTRLASVALRNANDGISTVSVGMAGLDQGIAILNRMSELARASANGTLTTVQRSALAQEFVLLASEVERTALNTTFNSQRILSDAGAMWLQVGLRGVETGNQILVPQTQATLLAVGLVGSGGGALTYSITGGTNLAAMESARSAMPALELAIETLTQQRATLGAVANRLEAAVSNLSSARDSLASAHSKIADADMASEVAQNVRLTILQQTQTSVLAHMGQNAQLVLNLIKDAGS